ncbi:DNA polymerase eta-like [Aphidius gifuensis]|uniref:DNA polymerase eta-like n=1 Tax=Aphidius gifuensis TaxID=684658 RepID=UPI001CDC530B|nr:DNA polymerase eta-like [Aphidius gifuensis]
MSESEERIIALIDMDCFFCQVESREKPELKGKPMVVSQFNMVLAVNYEARDLGISRFVRGDEAKEKYPDVNVVSVPERRGKGDISKYRSAGAEVINVLKQHCPIVERASIDEAFLDITDLVDRRMESTLISSSNVEKYLTNTFVVGYCDTTNDEDKRYDGMKKWINESFDNMGGEQERKLAIGAIIIEELRSEIYEKCEFKCSAGISYNKVLAKLACGLHKPNKQTILSMSSVPELFSTLSVNKIRNLGGKIGMAIVEKLNCNVMSDLLCFSMDQLEKQFDKKTAMWLFNIARGIDHEQVKSRLISKSIGASKNFWGEEVITEIQKLKAWIDILSEDISERLEQDLQDNSRRATALTVSYQYVRDKKNISQSRTSTLTSYKAEKISSHAFDIIKKTMQTPVSYLKLFPDLDNIDSSIVELLPSELQQEAKIYLKSNDKDLDQTNV